MPIGSATLGGPTLGGVKLGDVAPFEEHVFLPIESPPDLAISAPFIQFWEITPSNGQVSRFADFIEPTASTTLGQVTFNGEEWTSVKIGKPKFTFGKGRRSQASLGVVDPTRTVIKWAIDNGVRDAIAKVWIVNYANIDDPSKAAFTGTVFVNEVVATDNPLQVAFLFGGAELRDLRFPPIFFNREGCHNAFENRFQHSTMRNYCNYPSDEFQAQTKQLFDGDSDAETEIRHGWHTLNATVPEQAHSGRDNAGDNHYFWVKMPASGATGSWLDATRSGFYAYKIIQDIPTSDRHQTSDPDFDVNAMFVINTAGYFLGGILVQSVADPSDWLMWGVATQDDGFGGSETVLLSRVTTNDSTVEVTIADTGDTGFRVERSGSTFTLYSRLESLTSIEPSTVAWTQRRQETISISGDVRVGLVACGNPTPSGSNSAASFYHFRFDKGGFDECNRSFDDCSRRKNTIQRNGYVGLPDTIQAF